MRSARSTIELTTGGFDVVADAISGRTDPATASAAGPNRFMVGSGGLILSAAGFAGVELALGEEVARGGVALYHGADVASVKSIVRGGIDRATVRELGGGDVFWTTRDPVLTRFFAEANPAGGVPALVEIRVPAGMLERMEAMGVVSVEPGTGAVKVLGWDAFDAAVSYFRYE